MKKKLKQLGKSLFKKMPYYGRLIREHELFRYPPGHFYSPIPSIEEIKLKEKEIFESFPREFPGIELNESEQLALFEEFIKYYQDISFEMSNRLGLRYFFREEIAVPPYGYPDGIILYSMIRHVQPKMIIEIGSGHSSCLILDTNEVFFDNSISCTFIEPYPKKLLFFLKESDFDRIEILPSKLQDIELSRFSQLSAGDILFIDSTHVSKVNSDVNYIFFEILPCLKSGVYIHFHDIFYPFEYPKEWIYAGTAWNEGYILRAFLQYNNAFKVLFFNNFMFYFHQDILRTGIPLINKAGSSFWMKKL